MLSRRALLLAPLIPAVHAQDGQPNMFGDADAYERFMGRWSRMVAPPFVDFTDLPNRGRMLDVGSGTGSLAHAIAERKVHARVVGIDPSQEYVAYAVTKNSFPDRVSFEVGDAQQLHFPDASFEGALSLLVFNFIPDPKKALSELRRVTKPGGRISAAVWDYTADMRMLRTFWDAAVHIDAEADRLDEKHMPLCRSGELSTLWRQGGLVEVREQSIDVKMQFRSFADYWDPFLLKQGPAGSYVSRLDQENLQALRNEVKRRLFVQVEITPLALDARVWAVRGTVPNRR